MRRSEMYRFIPLIPIISIIINTKPQSKLNVGVKYIKDV